MTGFKAGHSAKFEVKKVVSWVGTALMVVSLGFIISRLRTYGLDLSLLSSPFVVMALFFVVVVESFGIIVASVNYRAILQNVSGIKVPGSLVTLVYSISNLYKYIPGGVMYVVGRNRLAVETEGLSHAKVALATIMEGALVIIAALIVSLVFSFEYTVYHIRQLVLSPFFVISVTIVVLIICTALYFLHGKIKQRIQDFFSTVEILKPSVIVKRFGIATFLVLMLGMTFTAVVMLMGQPMTASLAVTLAGLYLVSWMAGFLTPGAPSGLGIREVVMLMLMSGLVIESVLLIAMIMHRVVIILGDVLAYCISVLYKKTRGSG